MSKFQKMFSHINCHHSPPQLRDSRVTTCLENLEMSEILTAVSEMSRVLLKLKSQGSVGENILSGESGLKLFIVSCIFASILDFAEFVHFILVLFLPPSLTITLVLA